MPIHGLLITGPEEERSMFHLRVCQKLNLVNARGDTAHYTCCEEDLPLALAAASEDDVTIQRIDSIKTGKSAQRCLPGGACVTEHETTEDYPVLHQGSHLMKWEPKKS